MLHFKITFHNIDDCKMIYTDSLLPNSMIASPSLRMVIAATTDNSDSDDSHSSLHEIMIATPRGAPRLYICAYDNN